MQEVNPFFAEYDTPFGVPPFGRIRDEHYRPAFEEGMRRHKDEIKTISGNPQPPSFENTIEALEASGPLLTRVSNTFYCLNSANTNDQMQAVAREIAPLLAQHADEILMDRGLFERIRAVYQERDGLDLNAEQRKLLDDTYKDFVRGGANLDDSRKVELQEINKELSLLSTQFGENVLKENNSYEMIIDSGNDLDGLPDSVIAAASEAAADRGHPGKWVFTLHRPSMFPFLQYSARRELRERIFRAYIERGNHGNELDNKHNAARMAALRAERAQLLGYATHSHYVLEESMAKNPARVYALLDQLWKPALAMAVKEARELQQMIEKEGVKFELQPWDWWYYAEKVRKAKFDLDEEALRPYFKLEDVIAGAFMVANRLYGLTFEEQPEIPRYHPDVKAYEVKADDGSHVGIFYADYFPRASKEGGAWMDSFRNQSRRGGEMVTPVIYNVGNFTKPAAGKPSLLSFDEAGTLFHEFGHALHGLLSQCTYEKLSGTAVPRDFVELPSQIMENWASEPEVLRLYAKHYETGEPIPEPLIRKLVESNKFNQGFATVEYLAASYLDMDWHGLEEPAEIDPLAFEKKSMARIGLIPQVVVRYRTPYFSHIFSGGYSAGYYSYIWAEVLDADAFQLFKQKGLFDQEAAASFRSNILAKGGSEDPMTLYVRFRGAEPRIDALLEKRGLK